MTDLERAPHVQGSSPGLASWRGARRCLAAVHATKASTCRATAAGMRQLSNSSSSHLSCAHNGVSSSSPAALAKCLWNRCLQARNLPT